MSLYVNYVNHQAISYTMHAAMRTAAVLYLINLRTCKNFVCLKLSVE